MELSKVIAGIAVLLLIVGGIVYFARGALNRNLGNVVSPRITVRSNASTTPLPLASGQAARTNSPFPLPSTSSAGVGTTFASVSPRPQPSVYPAASNANLPATGL